MKKVLDFKRDCNLHQQVRFHASVFFSIDITSNTSRRFYVRPTALAARTSENRFQAMLLVFKALHGLAPDYIKNYCVKVSSRRCLRSSSHHRFVIPPSSKTVLFGERSFAVGGPSLWYHLPDNVKEAGSIELFKRDLKRIYLKYRHFLNFVTVPLTLVATMLRHATTTT